MCVLVVCFVLVNEVRFVQVLINKYVKIFSYSWFLSLVLIAHIIKQPRRRAEEETDCQGGLVFWRRQPLTNNYDAASAITESPWGLLRTQRGEWETSPEGR